MLHTADRAALRCLLLAQLRMLLILLSLLSLLACFAYALLTDLIQSLHARLRSPLYPAFSTIPCFVRMLFFLRSRFVKLLDQALDRLVSTTFIRYRTFSVDLSTSSSLRGLTCF